MAKNNVFNVHDLYPKGYCFNYVAFEADPGDIGLLLRPCLL